MGGQLGGAAGGHFGAGVEDVAQARHGDAGLLEVGPQLGHAHDGLGHALGKHVEGHELAYAEFASHDQVGAVPEGGGVDEFANQVDAFVRPAGEVLGFEAGADVGGELVVPAAGEAGLQGAGLDGLDAGDGFHQHGLVFCSAGELDIQALAQNGHHGQAQAKVQGQADQHDEGERHAVEQHDGHEEDGEHHVQQHGEGVAGEEAADVFQLAHAGHRVAHAPRLEVGQGQLHEVSEQPRAQFHINAAGGVAEDVAAQGVEQAFEHHDHHEADDQHVQGGQAAVHQDFVHDDLEEQGADQRKELQHEGDEQHFAQQFAVFDEAGDEPGEVELGQLARHAGGRPPGPASAAPPRPAPGCSRGR